ncbi:MAG: hypothetical protein AMXMBFR34_46010 [Myxococcaceae bacterium]
MRLLAALLAFAFAFAFALAGCGRADLTPPSPYAPCPDCVDRFFPPEDAGQVLTAAADAGAEDAGVVLPCGNVPFGPDCCAGATRVSSATCVDGAWACTQGSFCACEGQPQGFQCTDFCGSDAFVPPVCRNGQWICERPFVETTLCAPDTCWGEPGDCCGAPSCVDGGWVCGFKPAGC